MYEDFRSNTIYGPLVGKRIKVTSEGNISNGYKIETHEGFLEEYEPEDFMVYGNLYILKEDGSIKRISTNDIMRFDSIISPDEFLKDVLS